MRGNQPKLQTKNAQSKRRGWARFLTFLIVGTLLIVVGGFLSFAQHVDRISPPHTVAAADGIVVWTGKGGGRLQAGVDLLTAKKGERLLISGVHESNAPPQIKELTGLSDALAECCLDLDYIAVDTVGNARETASWAEVLGYDHLILVTSAYHMPRAKVEIANAAGRMRITPYPVERADSQKWYKSGDRARRLAQEYSKLLLALSRGRKNTGDAPELDIETINSD